MRTNVWRVLAWFALAMAQLGICDAQQRPSAAASGPQALDPAFWTLIDHGARLDVLGSGFGFTEGPVWLRNGDLMVSDEVKNFIFRLSLDGHTEQLIALGDPDGNTIDAHGQLIDCASVLRAIIRIAPDGKSYTVLADHFEGKKFNSPNDVTWGPDGALYFTDPNLDLVAGQKQEIPFQGVYRLDSSGKVTLLTRDLDEPNGLAFTPDKQFLFIDDSGKKNIRRYRFHHDGTLSDGIIFADESVAGSSAVPDGMKFDKAGNLWVTGPGGIWIWSQNGRHLGTILVPQQPANLTWGGRNLSTLFITAGTSVYAIRTRSTGFSPPQGGKW
jgi:gluconolactonase